MQGLFLARCAIRSLLHTLLSHNVEAHHTLRQFSAQCPSHKVKVRAESGNGNKRHIMKAEDGATNRTILFVNWAHALDHFVLLIFPTAVIAIAAELKRDYGDLIWLSTGAFVAFGLFALPIGWLADRFGRRALLTAFFFGYGAACLLVAVSTTFPMLAGALFLLGVFSAIYHLSAAR